MDISSEVIVAIYHEVAHAVMGSIVGYGINSIDMARNDDVLGAINWVRYNNNITDEETALFEFAGFAFELSVLRRDFVTALGSSFSDFIQMRASCRDIDFSTFNDDKDEEYKASYVEMLRGVALEKCRQFFDDECVMAAIEALVTLVSDNYKQDVFITEAQDIYRVLSKWISDLFHPSLIGCKPLREYNG